MTNTKLALEALKEAQSARYLNDLRMKVDVAIAILSQPEDSVQMADVLCRPSQTDDVLTESEIARLCSLTVPELRKLISQSQVQADQIGLAHEIWASAQLAPHEGIEDGVKRIKAILQGVQPVQVQAEPVAWMRDNERDCITDISKRQMEGTNFGQWKEVAASYTAPLYKSPQPGMVDAQKVIDAIEKMMQEGRPSIFGEVIDIIRAEAAKENKE